MSLRLLSYLASLGFRSELDADTSHDRFDCDDAHGAARNAPSEPAPADDRSQLKFVLAL